METLEYIKSEIGHANRDMFEENIYEIELLYKKFVEGIKTDDTISESFSQFDFNNLMENIKHYNINIHNIPYNLITNFIFSIDMPLNEKNEVYPNNFTTFFKGAFENFLEARYRNSKVKNNIEEELEHKFKIILGNYKEGLVNKKTSENNFDTSKVNEELKLIEVVYKLIDHISLAIEQKTGLYDKQKVEIKKMNDNIENFRELIDEETENIKDIQKKSGKIYTEFVSILGIFSSIIFGIFGGFQEIQLIGKNLNTTPIPKLLIFSSLVMLGITLIIFLCFNAISKLTSLSLKNCNCDEDECKCSFREKHPTVFYSSCVYLYILCVGFALRLYKHTDFTIIDMFNKWDKDLLPLILIFLPILLIIVIAIYKYLYKKINANQTNKTS
ncbi:hypothetical protein H3965_10345 [Staphylococcus epidermidis]|uniref:hypothetical protein n=1 Tax=Staphylococcus epidermidis TaxID=1282 RepID=UPI00138AB2AF|nr:hypothetical protein [Staphylococcus epidermidis]MBF2233407.1 hypothetical protein [Staphylococcus epidermidis]